MDDARPVQYGRRKLGKEAYEKQQEKNQLGSRQATIYGRRKAPQRRPEGEVPKVVTTLEDKENPFVDAKGGRVPVKVMRELIAKDPMLLDLALETELSHAEKPRKSAVEALRELEGVRPGGPRESVNKLLDKMGG